MANGALTIGTLDGANVEMRECVSDENIFIFGLNTHEVDELWRSGYTSRDFYHNSPVLKKVVDRFGSQISGQDFSHIFDYLINGGYGVADPFMCLADFDSYLSIYKSALTNYSNRESWCKKSLLNTARSGIFASDNSINNYAKNIWHASPVFKTKK